MGQALGVGKENRGGGLRVGLKLQLRWKKGAGTDLAHQQPPTHGFLLILSSILPKLLKDEGKTFSLN